MLALTYDPLSVERAECVEIDVGATLGAIAVFQILRRAAD